MNIVNCLREIAYSWKKHDDFLLSAAFSFYALISLAPLLYVFSLFALWLVGDSGIIYEFMEKVIGNGIGYSLKNISMPVGLSVVSLLMLIYGATKMISHIQVSLNKIWEIKMNIKRTFFSRVYSFFILFVAALLIPLLTIISSWFSFLLKYKFVDVLVSFVLTVMFFYVIYKLVPDAKIGWKGPFMASLIVSILYSLGKYFMGFYLSRNLIISSFGTAGSIIMFVLWIYYFSIIFFFGAELSRIFN